MIYKPQLVDIYDYKGVTMTGSHYIYENKNNLTACKDIGVYVSKSYEELYCPITSSGKLQLLGKDNTIINVADYNDAKTFAEWNYITDKKLNGSMNYTESEYKEEDATQVENNYKYLYNIVVNDNHNIEYKNILFKDFEETNM